MVPVVAPTAMVVAAPYSVTLVALVLNNVIVAWLVAIVLLLMLVVALLSVVTPLRVLSPPIVCVPAVTAPAVVLVALATATDRLLGPAPANVQLVPVTELVDATSIKLASVAALLLTVMLSPFVPSDVQTTAGNNPAS